MNEVRRPNMGGIAKMQGIAWVYFSAWASGGQMAVP